MGSVALEALGWVGSAVLVVSLMQADLIRLRVINLVGCLLLTVYNLMVGVWPMVGLNVVLTLVNAYQLNQLLRERGDSRTWQVLGVSGDDAVLRHMLRLHARDITAYNPSFVHDPFADSHMHYIMLKGDEMVGVVILRDNEKDRRVADLLLDWVTPKYRNMQPARYLFGPNGPIHGLGYLRVRPPADMVAPHYPGLGLDPEGDTWRLPR